MRSCRTLLSAELVSMYDLGLCTGNRMCNISCPCCCCTLQSIDDDESCARIVSVGIIEKIL